MHGQEKAALRRKIVGVLLRNAREKTGKSKKECAEALGCSTGFVTGLEQGTRDVSLPHLEVLSALFRIPMEYFWSDGSVELPFPKPMPPEAIPLRQRLIGAMLQKARTEAGKTAKECASFLGHPPSRISAYEYGKRDIPFWELQDLAEFVGVSIDYFFSDKPSHTDSKASPPELQESPAARPERAEETAQFPLAEGELPQQLLELPEDVREFVSNLSNVPYLRLAIQMSHLPARSLRQIAENLLDITF